jgi:hypothetical protein
VTNSTEHTVAKRRTFVSKIMDDAFHLRVQTIFVESCVIVLVSLFTKSVNATLVRSTTTTGNEPSPSRAEEGVQGEGGGKQADLEGLSGRSK